MNTPVSITELKINPAKFLFQADDYPIPVVKRGKITAYLVGKNLYDNLIAYIEDFVDNKAIKTTNFKKGRNFEDVAKDLNI